MNPRVLICLLVSLTLALPAVAENKHARPKPEEDKRLLVDGQDPRNQGALQDQRRSQVREELRQRRQALRADLLAEHEKAGQSAGSAGAQTGAPQRPALRKLTPEERAVLRQQLQQQRKRLLQDAPP